MASGLFNLKQVNQAISQGAWSGYIAPRWVEYLVVAGGGGGGFGGGGGGGGAGGLLTGIVTVTTGTSYTVTVGTGGAGATSYGTAGTNGVASVFGSISSSGGGGGGAYNGVVPKAGGSGGGAGSYATISGAQGISGQGNAGGAGGTTSGGATVIASGGGGGAGTVGLPFSTGASWGIGGNGGAGIASAISGTVTTYAGGGGGGNNSSGGIGGVGGGGNGAIGGTGAGTSGSANTGGGGGGDWNSVLAGSGGSGIVVVRYPGNVQFFTGGTVNYANGYISHVFYASGTLAPTTPTVVTTDYQITRSLRFNSADSTYLSRTPASAGNQKTWTWSSWVKKAKNTGADTLLSVAPTAGLSISILLYTTNILEFYVANAAGTDWSEDTSAVYRDNSSWYHVVLSVDTTQATAANRLRWYVNGVQQSTVQTYGQIPQNQDTYINQSGKQHGIGRNEDGASSYADFYLAEVNFIDGYALTPSSFGFTNPVTGVWSPAKFVGTYGTNGFYLNFSDNSNTTAATLGKDYSGNGNNWTPNNFSVTAGAGNDSLVDSPTSYGTDTGVGGTVRGNYCVWNPLDRDTGSTYTTYANGNLDCTVTGNKSAVATISVTSGKWYWEVVPTGNTGSVNYMIGVADANTPISTRTWTGANGWVYFQSGSKFNNNTSASYGASYTTNDVIGVALDMDAGTVTFYKNGTSQGVAYSTLSGKAIQPMVSDGSSVHTMNYTGNFGQRPFAYTAPSGYKALCTQNLPTPTIGATTATQAGKFFNPVLYTGNGSSRSITGLGFQPDFTWIKDRSAGFYHRLADAVRGAGKELYSNDTGAETTNNANGYVTSFNSDGFSLGTGIGVNQNGTTYVAWNWKANGSGSTNTAGSITSTVSANTTSGFSVVTYTGTGANATVGHGLGVAATFIILKSRSNVLYWYVYASALNSASLYGLLNTTNEFSTASTVWNNTAPTSTVFSIGTDTGPNTSGATYVAYCFAPIAGYSAFGSYTGNGSTDGPFVYTGFRPAYVLVKKSSSAGNNWQILDTKRSTYNVMADYLYASAANAEGYDTTVGIDSLSNGFKIRGTDGNVNTNSATYIYMAFAENPFKYSLAR